MTRRSARTLVPAGTSSLLALSMHTHASLAVGAAEAGTSASVDLQQVALLPAGIHSKNGACLAVW